MNNEEHTVEYVASETEPEERQKKIRQNHENDKKTFSIDEKPQNISQKIWEVPILFVLLGPYYFAG